MLCELRLSETRCLFFFVIDTCWFNFILHNIMCCYFSPSCSQMTAQSLSLLSILLLFLCEWCMFETLTVFVVVIDVCWLTFILHVLLFFSQSQPNDSSESLPAIDSSSLPMWVMHVWDSLSLLFVIAAYWLTFILRVLLFFSQSQPDDSSLLAPLHAMWVMPGWESLFLVICWLHLYCIYCYFSANRSQLTA